MIMPICGFTAASAAMLAGSMKWFRISQIKIKSNKILQNKPVRILHISDMHCCSITKREPNIYGKIQGLSFDIIVITGDIVLNNSNELLPHISALKTLAGNHRVFYVDGNHEKYVYTEVKKILENLGIIVLSNDTVVEEINENRIKITGIRDLYWLKKNNKNLNSFLSETINSPCEIKNGHKNTRRLTSGYLDCSDMFNLLLSHQPQIADYEHNADLILSGHTHGGQVRIPFLPALYAPGQGLLPKYDRGLYKTKTGMMYISSGIGATNFRLRFNNRPEIAVIILQHGFD